MPVLWLDVKPYHTKNEEVSWLTCTLRSWLNGYGAGSNQAGTDYAEDNFINAAFTATEQEALLANDDGDKVSLLTDSDACNTKYGFSFDKSEYDAARCSLGTSATELKMWYYEEIYFLSLLRYADSSRVSKDYPSLYQYQLKAIISEEYSTMAEDWWLRPVIRFKSAIIRNLITNGTIQQAGLINYKRKKKG